MSGYNEKFIKKKVSNCKEPNRNCGVKEYKDRNQSEK